MLTRMLQVPATRRGAIIDLDVHHGNGTEDRVRWRMREQGRDRDGGAQGGVGAGDDISSLVYISSIRCSPLLPGILCCCIVLPVFDCYIVLLCFTAAFDCCVLLLCLTAILCCCVLLQLLYSSAVAIIY